MNKQTIHCQREVAYQPEVTDVAGEKSKKSLFGNSPKLKEPTSGTNTSILQGLLTAHVVWGNAPEVPATFLLVLFVAVRLGFATAYAIASCYRNF